MAELTTIKKYHIILEEFNLSTDKTLTAYSEILKDRLSLGTKQILRLLRELEVEFDAIVKIEGQKRETFKLIKPIDLFVETFENVQNIDWFFQMAHDADPEIFKELENFTNQNKRVYKFINTPFEDIQLLQKNGILKKLESAVKLREYRKIKFAGLNHALDNQKCLKLLFIDNNWYIVTVGEDEIARLSRVSFVEDVRYATNIGQFQNSSVAKQMKFIEDEIQNSFSLYGVEKKKATIKVVPDSAKYFKKGMKKFLSSQIFQEELEDGSVLFTVEYTQAIEILPLIQKWMPNLVIVQPEELKEEYKHILRRSLEAL